MSEPNHTGVISSVKFFECNGCYERKPMTTEHFEPRYDTNRHGALRTRCRECRRNAYGRRSPQRNKGHEPPNVLGKKPCDLCCDISDRRPPVGPCECGELWQAEPALKLEDFIWRGRSHERVCA